MIYRIPLAKWAKANGITYQAAWNWFKAGKFPFPVLQTPTGMILVEEPLRDAKQQGKTVLYARVSSHDQAADLSRQMERLKAFAASNGMVVFSAVTEIGSGLNGKRRKLNKIVSDPNVSVLVVERRDRLARFGVEMLEASFAASGRKLVVIDDSEVSDDLVKDFIDMATSLCARLYGRRSSRNRALKAARAMEIVE